MEPDETPEPTATPATAAEADAPGPDEPGEAEQTAARASAQAVLAIGVPESARQRLLAVGAQRLLDEPSEAAQAELVVVSTRIPRGDLASLLTPVLREARCPVVVLAHTGGESLAVEVMRLGAVGVVAEGNEAALGSFLAGEAHDSTLLETYDRQLTDARGPDESARDEVTGLPRGSALEQRLAEYGQTGDVPRVAFARILHFDEVARRLAPPATALLRRRLATRYRELARAADVELFALTHVDFALLSEHLTPQTTEVLGARMAQVTETFAPTGNRTLALALGHAGPEVTAEISTLRELAHRALIVAAATQRSGVVGADALALGVSSTTELEAAHRLIAFVEQHDGHAPGHGERVAALAAAMARELGYDGLARSRVRLAAHLHDIGKVGLPLDAMAGPGNLSGEVLAAYRSHPVRGADYLRVSGGTDVADAVRHHHERWDGAGFPDGLAEDRIPLAARIIAVADRYDALTHGGPGTEPVTPDEAQERLAEEAGTLLDPELVPLLAAVAPAVEPVA